MPRHMESSFYCPREPSREAEKPFMQSACDRTDFFVRELIAYYVYVMPLKLQRQRHSTRTRTRTASSITKADRTPPGGKVRRAEGEGGKLEQGQELEVTAKLLARSTDIIFCSFMNYSPTH